MSDNLFDLDSLPYMSKVQVIFNSVFDENIGPEVRVAAFNWFQQTPILSDYFTNRVTRFGNASPMWYFKATKILTTLSINVPDSLQTELDAIGRNWDHINDMYEQQLGRVYPGYAEGELPHE